MKLIYNLQKSKTLGKTLKVSVAILVFLYILLIPSFGESSSELNILVYVAMGLLSVVTVLYSYLFGDFKFNRFTLLIPLFAVYAFIGTAIYSHEFKRWVSLVLLAISFFTFILSFKILKNKFLVIHIISIAFFLFSVLYIIHYRNDLIHFSAFATGKFRLGDDFDNPNGVAAFEVVGFAAPLYLLLFYKKKRRYFHALPLMLSIIVGVSTGSRSYILAIGLFVLILLFFVFKRHKLIYFIAVAAITLCFFGFLQLPFMSTIKDRLIIAFQTLFDIGNKVETSTLTRTIWLDYGFFLGFKNGIFGYGTKGFAIYSGVGTYAHNNFAEVICDFGFIGLMFFYLPLVVLLTFAIRDKEIDKSLIISFVAYYFVISFSNVLYYKKIYYMMLAFLYYLTFFEGRSGRKSLGTICKMIFTCDSMGSGGAEKVIATLSNEFSNRNIDVTIIGVSDVEKPKSFYNLNSTIKYISLNYGLRKKKILFARILLLRKTIKALKPSIVISFLPHVNVYTWLSLVWTKIPFVVSERNDPYSDPKTLLLRILKRITFVASDGCVFQTKDAMNYYKQSVIDKSIIIPNPFKQHIKVVHREKKNIVLAVGRLTEQKNHLLLLDAFAKANNLLREKYILRIYGDGSLKEVLVNHAKKLHISSFVEFKGNDNQWQAKEIDDALFVMSSDYEGMPNSLLEALSLGIPCLSTDCPCGGPKELTNSGFNISLVNTCDCDALAYGIVNCIREYGKYFDNENMELCNQFDVSIICDKWIEYIGRI